jgi:hypothetical protein
VQVDENRMISSPAVAAVWRHWQAGGSDLLVAELHRGGMFEVKVRTAVADNIQAVREAGVDTDIPPEFLYA